MIDQPTLSQPHARHELELYLEELRSADPRQIWRTERESGMVSGIDQLFHFFFDDHDFDSSAVGTMLTDEKEVRLTNSLQQALDAVLNAVGDADDDTFVAHPLWLQVRRAAIALRSEMLRCPNGS